MFDQGFSWCSKCEKFLSFNDFYKNKTTPTGYGSSCKNCSASYVQSRKPIRKSYYKQKNSLQKKKFVILFGAMCQRCGYCEFISGLDFHHIEKTTKQYDPRSIIYTAKDDDEKLNELDKCVLLCANCHRGYETGEWKAEFVKQKIGWAIKSHWLTPQEKTDYQPKLNAKQLSFLLEGKQHASNRSTSRKLPKI